MADARVVRLASRLGPRHLSRLEKLLRVAQGKGWGTETVREEAAAVRTLLGSRADDALTVLDVGALCVNLS